MIDADIERRIWQTLVESEGWRLFDAYARELVRSDRALTKIADAPAKFPGDPVAQQELVREVLAQRKAAEELMSYPLQRLRALAELERSQATPVAVSRRGGD